MLKRNGAPVTLVWPGGAPAGTGVFTDTGEFPNTNKKFFDRYNGGKELYLPGSAAGGSPGVRAQLIGDGRGEGHVEVGLGACLMRAAEVDNKWKITPDDVSERKVTADGARAVDMTLYDFMALFGVEGVKEAMSVYGSGSDKPAGPRPGTGTVNAELDTLRNALAGARQEAEGLRSKLADAIWVRDEAQKGQLNAVTKMHTLLRELDARAKGMKTAAGTKPKGQYQRALVKAAEGLEKTIADYRAGA